MKPGEEGQASPDDRPNVGDELKAAGFRLSVLGLLALAASLAR